MATSKSTAYKLTESDAVRFWKHVHKSDRCWLWTGARGNKPDNYGRFHVGPINGLTLRSHRVAYQLLVGPIPEGRHIIHSCDEPRCVNPAHLSVGTHADNMADMKAKGRSNGRLRGITHCVSGQHELSGDNLRYTKRGSRLCVACRRATEKRWAAYGAALRAARVTAKERTCPICGVVFIQDNRTGGRPAIYCSTVCRSRAQRLRRHA